MHLIVRTDGGARGNPGPAAAGVCIENPAGNVLFSGGFFLGRATNNVAEYQGILHGLDQARKLGGKQVTLYCDSELVTKQLNGQYRVKNPGMRECYEQVLQICEDFENVEFIHVLRHKNQHADAMVNEALDQGQDVGGPCESDTIAEEAQENSTHEIPVEQLDEMVRFDDPSQKRQPVGPPGKMTTDLICLKGGQEEAFKVQAAQGSLCVLRGSGTIFLEENSQKIKAGAWMALDHGQTVRLQAKARQEFVLLLTVAD